MDISFAFRKIQKSIAGLSILAVLASLVSFTGIASADTFPDVDSDHYAYDAVDEASDEGWMTGYDNGDFGVDDTLTRGQAAKLLVAGSGLDTVDDCDSSFSDVPTSYSLYDYVCSAEAYGFVGGYTDSDGDATGEYGPNDSVNRAQFAKMVVEAFGLASVEEALDEFPDVDEGVWYEESNTWYVSTAWAWSVINGYDNGNYYPGYDVTRGQAALMINRAQEPEYRADTGDDDDTTVSEGDLTVEVSSDSPDAMTIPSNATSVELAAWDFTANGGDVTIDSLSVHHYGITTLASAHQVYLYEGSTRLTSGTTVGSTDNEATFTYDIDVASGETRTISVRMDMGDYTATGEVGLEIASASKIDAGDATVDGDFPAQGAKHTISTTDAGTITIEKNGSVDNPQVGEDGAIVAKFKISAATEAAGLEELGLYFSGSINTADAQDFKLYVSGDDAEPIAEVASVDDLDVVRFDISGAFDGDSDECENSDGYCISKGGSKSFYMTVDFNTGRTDDTVEVYVDQSTDVFARGALYGSGMSVTRALYDGNANSCNAATDADCSYSVLEGGDITITSDGPSAKDIATNGRDVSILDFSIVSVTDVTFDSFPIQLDTSSDTADGDEGLWNDTDDAANFTDIKIVNTDTGSALFAGVDSNVFRTAIAGATNAAAADADVDDAAAFHLFTDDFEMSSGEELNLALTMDIRNDTVLDNMTIVGALDLGTTYPQLKDTNNKTLTNANVLVPTSDVTSKTMTVRSPSLALSLASTPTSGDNTYVKGSDDVPFVGIVFACGDSSDCRITDLTLAGSFDDDADDLYETSSTSAVDAADNGVNMTTVVGSVSLEDGDGTQVAAAKGVNSTTYAVTYDSMDWTIAAGATEILYVVGDVSSNSFLNSNGEKVSFAVASAANVTVEDEDGNSFSATSGGSTTGSVNAAETTRVLTSNGGSLTIATSSSTARENIAIAGSSDLEMSSFEFTSTVEAFLITDLSIHNRQDGTANGITNNDLGDADNNVTSVTIEYPYVESDDFAPPSSCDVTTETVSCTAYLVDGTATFSGQTFWIPADDSETITVYADLNTISLSGSSATAGEFVDLALSYGNFEAIAQSSGETYKADKLDADVAAASDLEFSDTAFASIAWIDTTSEISAAGTATALGVNQTLTFDNEAGADPDIMFPVGTLLCTPTDTDASPAVCTIGTDEIYVVTAAQQDGATSDTLTVMLIDNATADITTTKSSANNDDVIYALPGGNAAATRGFHTGTNMMVVYESKPTLALSSSSPSGSRAVAATDDAFIFSVTADSQEKIQLRAGEAGDDETDPIETTMADGEALVTSAAGEVVDGAAAIEWTGASIADEDCFLFDEAYATDTFATDSAGDGVDTTELFTYVSFWINSSEVDVTYDNLQPMFDDNNACAAGGDDQLTLAAANTWVNGTALTSGAQIIGGGTADRWELVTVDVSSLSLSNSTYFGMSLETTAPTTALVDTDVLRWDGVVFHNEFLVVDMTSDADFNNDETSGLTVSLKESGNTVAQGGVGYLSTSSAKVVLVPGGLNPADTYTTIEIAKGTTKTYTLTVDTGTMLDEDPGVDDPLTFSIDLGSSSNGTVTPGDFWWYETNSTVRWVGKVSSTTLNSNTVKY